MRIEPTIIVVKATRDLKFLHINAGRCPVTGVPRVSTEVESTNVAEFFLAPEIIRRVLSEYPETEGADIPEAFQVKFIWID